MEMEKHNQKNKSTDEMTIKEAIVDDIAQAVFRGTVIVDPAPAPHIPITPLVIGKKAIKGVKQIFRKLK